MLRFFVCDDDAEQLQKNHEAVTRYMASLPGQTALIRDFHSPREVLAVEDRCDIAILDIYLQDMDGTVLAQELKRQNRDVQIIFVTNSNEFASEAFAVGASHYLIKPFTQTQMAEALGRAIAAIQARPTWLPLSGENGAMQLVRAEDILYIESIGYRRHVHTAEAVYIEQRKTLSALRAELDTLRPGQFIVPYRGYIVNLDAIRGITPKHIVLRDGSHVLIKAGDFRRLRATFVSWTFSYTNDKNGGGYRTIYATSEPHFSSHINGDSSH